MPKKPAGRPIPPSRCNPRVDQLISEVTAASLAERRRVAVEGGDFQSVLGQAAAKVQALRPELVLAAERGELLPLIVAYLEVSYFTGLGWGGLAHNPSEPPSWTFLDLFQASAIDIPLQEMNLDRGEAAIPPSVMTFIERFEAGHGRYGLQVLLIAMAQFISRHEMKSEATVISVRGGHAGLNDSYLSATFCARIAEVACCVALYTDDVRSFATLPNEGISTRRLTKRALELLDAGRVETAIHWLELEPSKSDLGSHRDPNSIMNLRISAARRSGNRDALLRHLTAAYRETFERNYLSMILDLFSCPDRDVARLHLIGLAEATCESHAAEAFKLLVDEREWASLERLQARHHGNEILLVSLAGSLDKLAGLIASCEEHAPLVADHLRLLQDHTDRQGRRRR